MQGAYALVATDPHTLASMLRLVERGHLRTRHAAHDASGHLEHGNLHAPLACGRRDLQADVAPADDDDPSPRGAFGPYAVGIGDVAQVVHAAELAAGSEETARTASGREQQRVVRQDQPVIEPDVPLAARDAGHLVTEVRRDRVIREKSCRPDEEAIAIQA